MLAHNRRGIAVSLVLVSPVLTWLWVVKTYFVAKITFRALYIAMVITSSSPLLMGALMVGLLLGVIASGIFWYATREEFKGGTFKKFLRGSQIVSSQMLSRKTRERKTQVTIAGIPMPSAIENVHLMVAGSTGSGKSYLIREVAYKALLRGDRMIVADPNGDMLAKFSKPNDIILNPYDARTQGWSFFNEVRSDYDFKRLALSIVPKGKSHEEESWNSFARLLLTETSRKLAMLGKPSVEELFRWTTLAPPQDLQKFLEGTAAESLFVGADRALASARFVLSDKLPEHLTMPGGDFSIREWLADENAGNLFITWREDMAASLKPLISAWVDVFCSSILSLPENFERRTWLFIDELASMDKLASLEAALTKGRKHGLRVVAGLQSTAQLDDILGEMKPRCCAPASAP